MEHQIRIIDGTVRSTGFNITVPEDTQATLTRIKSSLKKDAAKWYDGLVAKRHEFLVLVKQNWDSINELKKLTLDNYSNAIQTNNAIEIKMESEALLYISKILDLTDNTQNYTYDNHNEVRNNNVASALSILLEKKLVEYSDAQNRYIVTEGGRQLLTDQELNVSKDELTS